MAVKKKESEYVYCSNRKCELADCKYYIKNSPFDVELSIIDMCKTYKGVCKNYGKE